MQWLDQWRALAARIEGFIDTAEFFGKFSHGGRNDVVGIIGKSLMPEAKAIDLEIQQFARAFEAILPAQGRAAFQDFLSQDWLGGLNIGEVAAVAHLLVLRSRFEYVMRDTEAAAKSRVELAFEHLRRLLVADSTAQERWNSAFKKGETHCEKLGAVHLLGHGIWAFKVSGGGAATDLVMNEPVQHELAQVERTGNALVLTEWKLVREAKDLERRAAEAVAQTRLYAAGVLGGVELKRTRYVVLVTATAADAPGDVEVDGIAYRHIVVAINHETPSAAARRRR